MLENNEKFFFIWIYYIVGLFDIQFNFLCLYYIPYEMKERKEEKKNLFRMSHRSMKLSHSLRDHTAFPNAPDRKIAERNKVYIQMNIAEYSLSTK